VRASIRQNLRLAAFIAAGHFLLFHLLFGLAFIVPAGQRPPPAALVLLVLATVLVAPGLLAFSGTNASPVFLVPPGSAIGVALCSVVWSIAICLLLFAVRRFVRYRPSTRLVQRARRGALMFAVPSLSWLFFGPFPDLAGHSIFGVLAVARHIDGRLQVRPLWLVVSMLVWAICIFGAYRFLIPPSTHELPPKV